MIAGRPGREWEGQVGRLGWVQRLALVGRVCCTFMAVLCHIASM